MDYKEECDLKKSLFFVDKEKEEIEFVYYNPDSDSNSQFVINVIGFFYILRVYEKSNNYEEFFENLKKVADCYLADKGTSAFDKEAIRFNSETHDFINESEETMNCLIDLASNWLDNSCKSIFQIVKELDFDDL